MDKKSKNTLIVSIIALALVLIGVTYAYFSARITGLESASTLSLTAGRMGIVYSEGDENVSVSNIYPREEAWLTKTITLTGYNTTDREMYYEIGLNVETNSFNNKYLTYDLKVLESTSGTPINEKIGVPINGSGFIRFGKGTFTNADGDVHRYELKIYFKDNGLDQNDAQGAVFNAKVSVVEHVVPVNECYIYDAPIISYDINYDNCMNYVSSWEWPTEEQQETYCTGGEFKDEYDITYSIEIDIENGGGQNLASEGVIENVVYGEPYLVDLVSGFRYTNGQYNYVYYEYIGGWRVTLADMNSTDPVTTKLCTTINNKPIVSMEGMFNSSQATSIDLSSFDTSSVTTMQSMFYNSKFTSLDLSNFDTSNVTNMFQMFRDSAATSLDLSSFDTSNVTDMRRMFEGSQASKINLSSLNTSKISNMEYMFEGSKVTTLDLTNFDLSKVNNMTSMFANSYVEKVKFSKNERTAENTNLSTMFQGSKATQLDLSNFFDTSNVKNTFSMFNNSSASNLDLTNFNTSSLTMMRGMFWNCQAISIDLSSFDTSKVTDMGNMFSYSPNLTTIYATEKFVVTAYTPITSPMFVDCTNLVGGAGFTYDANKASKFWARIDGGPSKPGYFTLKS